MSRLSRKSRRVSSEATDREQLLELIDDEQQPAVVGGKNLLDDPQQPPLVGGEVVDQIRRMLHRHPQQRCLELLEGVGAGEHVGDQPAARACKPTRAHHRYQTGPHHRRLAAPRRPHHRHQRMGPHRLQQLVDEAGATVKIEGIGFGEGAQPLVRVAYGGQFPGRLFLYFGYRYHVGAYRSAHGAQKVSHPLVAVGGPVVRCPSQHLAEFGGQPGAGIAYQREGSPRRLDPGEQMEGEHSQAEDVGLGGEHLAPRLLGREVGQGGGHGDAGGVGCPDGDAEIGEVGVAFLVEQHVARFEVAVDDSPAVGIAQGPAHFVEQPEGRRQIPRAVPQRLGQAAAPHVGHNQVCTVGVSPEVEKPDDVGVLQLSYELCLGLEPAHEIWPVDKLGPDHLDRYLPAHRGLVGPVDDPEVAFSHLFSQLIAPHCSAQAMGGGSGRSQGREIGRGRFFDVGEQKGRDSTLGPVGRFKAGSCSKICCSRSRSCVDGSIPSSSPRRVRTRW